MMRSRSEDRAEPSWIDERLRRRERAAVRLEFRNASAIEEPASRESTDPVDDSTEESPATEIAVLREELRLQAEQLEASVGAARRESEVAARAQCAEEYAQGLAQERKRIDTLCAQVERERSHYFESAEAEVVRLALAIAAQVLHREVKLDPLLLSGVVRVALEQIRHSGNVRLRVPAGEVNGWQETLSESGNVPVEIVGDESLSSGDCVLESSAGRIDLGVRAQLEEIERGFFDLLEKRPT